MAMMKTKASTARAPRSPLFMRRAGGLFSGISGLLSLTWRQRVSAACPGVLSAGALLLPGRLAERLPDLLPVRVDVAPLQVGQLPQPVAAAAVQGADGHAGGVGGEDDDGCGEAGPVPGVHCWN